MTLSKHPHKLYELILLCLFGVIAYISQVVMSALPNIEIVTLLFIIITRRFGIKALSSVYVFAFCEILTYGFHIWSINYLYVWTVLVLIILPLRKIDNIFIYTLIGGIFGLLFGTLCSIPYFIIGGISFGVSYILTGISFDFLHLFGNTITIFFLYKPLTMVMNKIKL